MYLSHIDALDSKLRKLGQVPKVVSSYNFACLINLPEQMRTYGPLRWYWEGKKQGEGYLPEIKPWHKQGIRDNWAPCLLANVMRDRSFRNLMDPSKIRDWKSLHDFSTLRNFSREFHKHTSIAEVGKILLETKKQNKKPLSVILVQDEGALVDARIFVAIGTDCDVVEIGMVGGISGATGGTTKMGLSYYCFHLMVTNIATPWQNVFAGLVKPKLGFAILLPLLEDESSDQNCRFSLVSSNWQKLSPTNNLKVLVDYTADI